MSDIFDGGVFAINRPITHGEVADISSADHEFTNPTRAVWLNGAGNVVGRLLDDDDDVTILITGQVFLPLRFSHIRQSGTSGTITQIVGLW